MHLAISSDLSLRVRLERLLARVVEASQDRRIEPKVKYKGETDVVPIEAG
jgi:hypothetical protein